MSKKQSNNRGKPKEWSDDELKKLAFDLKHKYSGKKITPSMLQRETGVGRNTWSRRMKEFLDELNSPVIRSISISGTETVELPNIDEIFNKYANNKIMLKNELIQLEEIIYQLWSELSKTKEMGNKRLQEAEEIQLLKKHLKMERKRANHYEHLYNTIVSSSLYPHLHDQSPILRDNGIKDNLINFENNREQNISLKNLTSFFPDELEQNSNTESTDKSQETISKLRGMFDI